MKRARARSEGITPAGPRTGSGAAVRRARATPLSPLPRLCWGDENQPPCDGFVTPVPSSACFRDDYAPAAELADDAGTALALVADAPRLLPTRKALLQLCLQHLGRDFSGGNLSREKLARKLPADVVAAAVAEGGAAPLVKRPQFSAEERAARREAKVAAKAARADDKAARQADTQARKAAAQDARARRAEAAAAAEAAREERAAAAEARAAALAPRRDAALARHLPALRPFIPADVASRLEEAAASAAAAGQQGVARAARPAQLLATLQPHQERGFRYLTACYADGLNPLLGDDMGLGKTLQAISLLAHATFRRDGGGPHLVVCPLSVLPSWQGELARWCPALRVLAARAGGGPEEKSRLAAELADVASYDVALTTYDAMLVDGPLGAALRGGRACWDVLVLDEAHRVKNEAGALGKALRGVRRACTLLMSGTLLQNNLHELWALLNLNYPDVFTDAAPFDAAFRLDGEAAGADEDALRAAHALLKALCLRREKAEVARDLPPRTEARVQCPMAPRQVHLYRSALRRSMAAVDGDGDTRTLKSLCMELRLICGHPRLIELSDEYDVSDDDDTSEEADEGSIEALLRASGKLEVLDRLLTSLKAGGHRVVLFSQFTSMLDILARLLQLRGHAYARLDGSVCPARRAVDIMRFNAAGSNLFAFLATTKAGGVGINLQSADTVILYDSDWNPQQDEQAMARVHRIGQTKPVAVFRLLTSRSVEERITARAEKKLYLDAVVAKGDASLWSAADLRHGADALFTDTQDAAPSDAELAALCDRSAAGVAARAAQADKASTSTAVVLATALPLELSMPPPPLRAALAPEDADAARAEAAEAAAKRAAAEADLPRAARRKALREAARRRAAPPPAPAPAQRRRQVAGVDYNHSSHCQVCWDGGDLFCCDSCPAAYHAECLGLDADEIGSRRRWVCPHHACRAEGCGRVAAAAGGLIFRCESCPDAFCAAHLPEEVLACGRIVESCDRFRRLGQAPPAQAMFVHCSEDCAAWAAQNFGLTADDLAQLAPPRPAWACDGDEELALPTGVALRSARFAELKAYLLQLRDPAARLPGAEQLRPLRNLLPSDGDQAFAALYAAARTAIVNREVPREREAEPERAQLSDDDDSDGVSDGSAASGDESSEGSESEDMAGLEQEVVATQPRSRDVSGRRRRVAWTEAESAALQAAVDVCGTRWSAVHAEAIARGVKPVRSAQDMAMRFYRMRDVERRTAMLTQQLTQAGVASAHALVAAAAAPGVSGRRRIIRWTADETATLRDLVAAHGEGNWRTIRDAGVESGGILAIRTTHDVRQRWQTLQLPKGPWALEEERLFVRLVERHGVGAWFRMRQDPDAAGTLLANRSGQQLKDKWRTMVRFNHPALAHLQLQLQALQQPMPQLLQLAAGPYEPDWDGAYQAPAPMEEDEADEYEEEDDEPGAPEDGEPAPDAAEAH